MLSPCERVSSCIHYDVVGCGTVSLHVHRKPTRRLTTAANTSTSRLRLLPSNTIVPTRPFISNKLTPKPKFNHATIKHHASPLETRLSLLHPQLQHPLLRTPTHLLRARHHHDPTRPGCSYPPRPRSHFKTLCASPQSCRGNGRVDGCRDRV